MVLYGFPEIFKTVIGVSKITVRSSFSCPVSHFFRNIEVSFMVLYGFPEISKTVIGVSKITVRSLFSCPVSHFCRYFEVMFVAVYSVLEIFGVANMTIPFFFLSPLSNFIGNLVGVFKITIRLCLSFLSHSNNKLQIRSTTFQEDSCGCHIFAGFAISALLQKSILDMLQFHFSVDTKFLMYDNVR